MDIWGNVRLLGNIAALIGCVIMVCIGLIRKKNHILLAQCAQFTFMGLGNLALGAAAGVIANVVSILRNITFSKFKPTWWLKTGFVVIQIALTLWTGIHNVYEWLPIISVIIFTLSLSLKTDSQFKLVLGLTQLLWLVYDLHYQNYVSAVFDVLTVVSTLVGIWMIQKAKKGE